jgi:hypothetical protein
MKAYLDQGWLILPDDNERKILKDERLWYSTPDSGYGALEEAVGGGEQLEVLCFLLQSNLSIEPVWIHAMTVEPVLEQAETYRRTGLASLLVFWPENKDEPEWAGIYRKWTSGGLRRITLI